MQNELISQKSWNRRNLKWITLIVLFSLLSLGLFLTYSIDEKITDIAQAYTDHTIYENAIEKAKSNKRVLAVLGNLKPMDHLAILEGNSTYTNNNNSVITTVRVLGTKGKGKMDISANRNGKVWKYSKITIRINVTKEEIQILSNK